MAVVLVASCKGGEGQLDLSKVDRSGGEIPVLEVARIAAAPVVDGATTDEVWKSAASTGPFVSPGNGKPVPSSKVNAEALLVWDDEALYVAVKVFDSEPWSPFGREDVDPHIWSKASGIELMLQPGDRRDNRNYYEIQVDANEAVWDTRFDDYNRPITGGEGNRRFGHQDWDSKIQRRVNEHSSHYTVELAIPWSAFAQGAPKSGDAWRANFYSFRNGQRDSLAWSPILGQGNFHKSRRFGRLIFR